MGGPRAGATDRAIAFLARAAVIAKAPAAPGAGELAATVEAARTALRREPEFLRPRDARGRPGGLVLLPRLPTVILPDLHARPRLIASTLAWTPPGLRYPLARLLEAGKASLVCLGDVFHSEYGSAQRRWAAAYREYLSGWTTRASMDEEMGLSLAAARILLEAKAAFPGFVHYIKGNHDNIADEEARGDHSF